MSVYFERKECSGYEILGSRTQGKAETINNTLGKENFTFWNKCKKLIGKGPLTEVDYSSKKLNAYLVDYLADLKKLKTEASQEGASNSTRDAYLAACQLANKIYLKNSNNDKVFKALSFEQKFDVSLDQLRFYESKINYTADTGISIKPRKITQVSLYTNPAQTLGIFKKQINQQLPQIKKAIDDDINELHLDSKLLYKQLAPLEISQRTTLVSQTDDFYIHTMNTEAKVDDLQKYHFEQSIRIYFHKRLEQVGVIRIKQAEE